MRRGGGGFGGRIAVASSCALLGVCLAGGPLYVSSAASESVQLQLAETCLTDVAVHMPYSTDPRVLAALDEVEASLVGVEQPIVSSRIGATFLEPSSDFQRPLVLVYREGQEAQFDPPLSPIGTGEAIVPDYLPEAVGLTVGETEILVDSGPAFRLDERGRPVPIEGVEPSPLLVAGTHPSIPFRPEPSFWCGFRDDIRPTPLGDAPPPMVLVSLETMQQFPFAGGDWEARPVVAGMTRDDAHAFQRRLDEAFAIYARAIGFDAEEFSAQFNPPTSMAVIAGRAETVADVVGRTMAPVRLAGVAASILVLAASGVMVARERKRELRLLAVRGVGPRSSMARLAMSMALPCIGGAVLGFGLALLAVRTLGPTPELETGPFREAAIACLVGGAVALLFVSFVTALAGDRAVDARTSRSRWRHVPFELIVPALAVVAFLRLDKVGGVRLVGSDARGGDLLAQSFPLLALAAPVALLARPSMWLVRRLRYTGAGLPDALRLGIRRVVAEPVTTVLVLLASALAAGCVILSSTLSASAERQLVDKATTYIGSDQSIRVVDPIELPSELQGIGTTVGRLGGRVGAEAVKILAIDPDTFIDAVHWRDDEVLAGLPDLIESLRYTEGQPAPAVVVGELPATFDLAGRRANLTVPVTVTKELAHFPGYSNGPPMVVVDEAALDAAGIGGRTAQVWLRDPPADAVEILRAAGARPTSEGQRVEDVFDVTSFRAVRWSYSALAAFGVLVAVVVLMMQVLAIDARRQSRQSAHVVMSRMGFGRRRVGAAAAVEVGVPLGVGVVFGVLFGALVAAWSVRRLDTLRQLKPVAVVEYDLGALAAIVVGTVLALVLLSALAVWSTLRARPLEVMRGTV